MISLFTDDGPRSCPALVAALAYFIILLFCIDIHIMNIGCLLHMFLCLCNKYVRSIIYHDPYPLLLFLLPDFLSVCVSMYICFCPWTAEF